MIIESIIVDLNSTVIINLITAFIVGGLWVTIASYTAERFGSRIGGFVSGLPSTAVVSYFFIGVTQTPQAASDATTVFPLSFVITGLFLLIYAILAKKVFLSAFIIALTIWIILSILVIIFFKYDFVFSIVVYLIIFSISTYIFVKRLKIQSQSSVKNHYTYFEIVVRFLLSGVVITSAVLAAKYGGPTLGGIFSGFPAVMISTLVISYRSNGIKFSKSLTKPMFITSMTVITVYVVSIRYLYVIKELGLVYATILSFLISMAVSYIIFRLQRNG